MKYIDLLSVFIAAIVYSLIILFWYSKYLFKNIYKQDFSKKFLFFSNFIFGFIYSFVFAFIEIKFEVTTFKDGVYAGFFIWLGMILPLQYFLFFILRQRKKVVFLEMLRMFITSLLIGAILIG